MDAETILRHSDPDFSGAHERGCIPSLRQARLFVQADLHRYAGRSGIKAFARHYLFTPGFKYTVWMRYCSWAKGQRLARYCVYPLLKWRLLQLRYKFGIAIPEYALVGPGLFINRFGQIFIVGDAVIGANVNLTAGVTIGYVNRGKSKGSPVVGDRVFFASGAKAIGRLAVGDDSVLGVNCVLAKSVAPMSVAVGLPGKVINSSGSDGYINNQVPDELIARTGWHEMLGAPASPAVQQPGLRLHG